MNCEVIRLDLNGVNAYLLATDFGFVLFDTGGHIVTDRDFDRRDKQLFALLGERGVTPGNLKLILLSHGDHDHTANAAALRDAYGAPIAMHRADLLLVEKPAMEMLMRSFHYRPLPLRVVFRLLHKTIRKATARALDDYTAFAPDIYAAPGDSLEKYGVPGRILHLPGHTAGSIGLLLADGRLLSGDTLTGGSRPAAAANAIDFAQLDESVQLLKGMVIDHVYPGHGEPFPFSELR